MHKNSEVTNPDQWNIQDEFWYSIIQKYLERNESLKKECISTEETITQLDSTLPPYFSFQMSKLANTHPRTNVDGLLTAPSNETFNKICTCGISEKVIPAFLVKCNNQQPQEITKRLIKDEKSLLQQINRLKSKENALLELKSRTNKLLKMEKSNSAILINVKPEVLRSAHDNLLDRIEETRREILITDGAIDDLKNKTLIKLSLEIDEERKKNDQLSSEILFIKTYKTDNSHTGILDCLKGKCDQVSKKIEEQIVINEALTQEIVLLKNTYNDYKSKVIQKKMSELNPAC